MKFSASCCLLLSTGLLAPAGATAQERSVHGLIRDAASGERLPYATLMVKGSTIGTKSNMEGYFILRNIPDTAFWLQARFVGYVMVEVPVDPRKTWEPVVIEMKPQDVQMEGVTISAEEPTIFKTETEPSHAVISPRQIATLPNVGQADIFRSMQLLPGISATNDRSSGLYVRGGTPDQNLILFDGMTVYHVDHFFGFFSAFNPDAVKDVQFYKGGFPALYGGRLSSVVDMSGKTGDPNNLHIGAGLNLLSGNAIVEVPLFHEGSLVIAARRSYSDIITSGAYNSLYQFLTGTSSTANAPGGFRRRGGNAFSVQQTPSEVFGDLNSKITYNVSAQDIASLSFYSSSDDLDNSNPGGTRSFGNSGFQVNTPPVTDQTKQSNLGVSGKVFHQWSHAFYTNIVLATAKYASTYDFGLEESTPVNNGQNRQSTHENNGIRDNTLRIDNQWIADSRHQISFGTQITRTAAGYSLSASTIFNSAPTGFLDLNSGATQTAFYGQDTWKPFSSLEMTAGVRATAYSLTSQTFFEPRLSARYALTDWFSLKGAYGRYHQFVNRIINENVTEGSRDFWVLSDAALAPGAAVHYILGTTLEDRDYLLDIEAYYKGLDNLVEFSQRFRRTSDEPYSFFSGSGTAKGVDVLLQKKQGALNGWISYTLGRAENTFPALNGGSPFPAEQDQTHELKLVGNLSLGANWTFSSTFIYGSGEPYTAPISQYSLTLLDSSKFLYTHVSDKDAYRLPSYQRLDASISKRLGEENETHWLIGLSAFNLLNHTNVEYYQYDLNSSPIRITEVTGLGFTPTLFVQIDFE